MLQTAALLCVVGAGVFWGLRVVRREQRAETVELQKRGSESAPRRDTATHEDESHSEGKDVRSSGTLAQNERPASNGAYNGFSNGDASARPAAAGPAPTKGAAAPAQVGGAGVLARLRAERAAHAAAQAAKKAEAAAQRCVTFLYASQTGTAEEIARSLHDEAVARHYKSRVASMNDWTAAKLSASETPVLVIVASSTGDGDAPDNAARCVLQLKKLQGRALAGVQFSVCGLGDSNYTKFMHVPRLIRRRLHELGAAEFADSTEADEVDGLEDVVDAWRETLWDPLKEAVAPESNNKQEAVVSGGQVAADLPADFTAKGGLLDADAVIEGVPALRAAAAAVSLQARAVEDPASGAAALSPSDAAASYRDPQGRYSAEQPYWARIKACELLSAPECPKRIYHLCLDVADAGMTFKPGDSMALAPSNDPGAVDALLAHMSWDPRLVVSKPIWLDSSAAGSPLPHLMPNRSLRDNLLWACDLASPPSKSLLVTLASFTSGPQQAATLRYLASRDGRSAYKQDIVEGRPSLLALLQRYDTCAPPASALLAALPPLRLRHYSLVNSHACAPGSLEAAFHVVQYRTAWGEHHGVATSWLERIAAGKRADALSEMPRVPVHLPPSTGFHPPQDASVPLIMIGPGTGVAPYRGFLQERRAQRAAGARLGESWLFFGNWKPEWDYLYRDDWQAFLADGTLTHLSVAWSRATDKKVYVQHKMQAVGEALAEALMERSAAVYVCGDGAHMAKDVHAALSSILQKHGDLDVSESQEFLKDLAAQGRYLKDVWS